MDDIYVKKEDLNRWVAKYFKDKELISVGDLIGCIEDLDSEVDALKDKIKDIERDIEDNYKPIDPATQYNVSDSWFH